MLQCANRLTKDSRSRFSGSLAIDERWSSPKTGLHGTVSAVDSVNHEVIAFSTEKKIESDTKTIMHQRIYRRTAEYCNKKNIARFVTKGKFKDDYGSRKD